MKNYVKNRQNLPASLATISRRKFVTGAATAAAVAAAVPLEPLLGGKESRAEASVVHYRPGSRAEASHRTSATTSENSFQPALRVISSITGG